MSWTNELYQLYDKIAGNEKLLEQYPLLPLYHSSVNAQIALTITEDGTFAAATRLEDKTAAVTIIPVTEDSGTRTSSPAPHPYADKLEYIAGDYMQYCNVDNLKKYEMYCEQLHAWANSAYSHPAVMALEAYIKKRTLVTDLVQSGVLKVDAAGKLTDDKIAQIAQSDCFVRVAVNYTDLNRERRTWLDQSLYQSYIAYQSDAAADRQLCYATGKETVCTYKHPSKILNAGSKAKLFSANDESGFTYRGRFANKEQAVSIGYEFSQKMHGALKWLIDRQGITIEGSLKVVAWETCLASVPKIDEDAFCLGAGMEGLDTWEDTPETFASYQDQLSNMIFGCKQSLDTDARVMVLLLDAATPGRVSVNLYSELLASDFYENLLAWHRDTAWYRYDSAKKQNCVNSFGIRLIADYAFGTETGTFVTCKPEIRRETYSRLLPCIIEGRKLPEDIVRMLAAKASRPQSYETNYWRMLLEVACGMIRKNKIDHGEECNVGLDKTCRNRDYLYGRLLAVAEVAERATYDAGETRVPNALRYFSMFSNQPYRTWAVIRERLEPYLEKMKPGQRQWYTNLIDDIIALFDHADFTNNGRLKPEYLHAYSCQRKELYTKQSKEAEEEVQ